MQGLGVDPFAKEALCLVCLPYVDRSGRGNWRDHKPDAGQRSMFRPMLSMAAVHGERCWSKRPEEAVQLDDKLSPRSLRFVSILQTATAKKMPSSYLAPNISDA